MKLVYFKEKLKFQGHDDGERTFVMLFGLLHTTLNKPMEREISLSNKALLSQSDLIRMFFISYDPCDYCRWSLKAKQNPGVKRIWLRILILTNTYSWQNWAREKVRIIEVRLYYFQGRTKFTQAKCILKLPYVAQQNWVKFPHSPILL